MIIISLSQDLEDNPNLIIIDCINHLAIFFLPANWWNASTGQSLSPSSIQSLLTCGLPHLWKKISQLCGGVRAPYFMFEGGNLLNLNLTPVTNTPWKHCNFTSCVTQSQSHLCQRQSDLFIILFLRKLCAILHLPTTICILCVHKKKQTWPFLPEICYSIVSAWS